MRKIYKQFVRGTIVLFSIGALSGTASAQFDHDVYASGIQKVGDVCGLPSDSFDITIENHGSLSQSSVPVKLAVSGTLNGSAYATILNGTWTGTLDSGQSAVIRLGGVNTAQGGELDFAAYTELSSEQNAANDTFYSNSNSYVGIPSIPSVSSYNACGESTFNLSATATAGDSILWYDQANGGSVLNIGSSYTTPQLGVGNHTYYASAGRGASQDEMNTIYQGGNGQAGNMFDVYAKTTIRIDSFAINFDNTGSDDVRVYYKQGTYVGFGTNAGAWTLLGQTTIQGQGAGNKTYVDIGGLTIPAGQTYGICVLLVNSTSIDYTNGANTYNNADMTITTGYGVSANFGGTFNPRTWNGTIYYTLPPTCESPRTPVNITVNPRPQNMSYLQGSTFDGTFNDGSASFPDYVGSGDQIDYEIPAPTGFNIADFGTTWAISALDFSTDNGTPVNSADTSTSLPGASNGSLSFTPDPNVEDSTYVISVTVQDLNTGCDTTIDRYIYVASRPDPSFTLPQPCAGEPAMFQNTSTITSGVMTYKWYFGDGDSSDNGNPNHVYAMPGSYLVTLIATSDFGVSETDTMTITVKEVPQAAFTHQNACEGDDLTFNDASILPSGNTTWSWDFGDGNQASGASTSHQYGFPGTYNVTMTVNTEGCVAQRTKTVTQAPRATVDFTATSECNNAEATFDNNSSLSIGTFGSRWDFGDGSQATAFNTEHLYAAFGTFDVTLYVRTDLGCLDSITKQVTLKESPGADFSNTQLCSSDTVYFTNTTSTPGPGVNYTWTFGDGSIATSNDVQRFYGGPGEFTLKLRADAANGCSDSITKSFTVLEKPNVTFIANDVCEGNEVDFINTTTSAGSGMTFVWDFGDGNPVMVDDTSFLLAPGNYAIKLAAILSNGCGDTVTRQLNVNPNPQGTFTYSSTFTMDGGIQFLADETAAGTNYQWFFGDGARSSIADPQHKYVLDGNYTVRLDVSSDAGCSSTSDQQVNIFRTGLNALNEESGFEIYPNPNKGVFHIESTSGHKIASVQVMNLTGQVVYVHNQDSMATKTTLETKDLAAGTYLVRVQDELGNNAVLKVVIQ